MPNNITPLGTTWPLPGGRTAWPVYRGSDAHIRDGDGPGVDLGNSEGLPWLAMHDGSWHTYPQQGADGRAGWFADLLWHDEDGHHYVARYCHGQHRPIADPDWYSDHAGGRYVTDYDVVAGQRIGTVGHTGATIPTGIAGAHLHLTMWRDGDRIWPEEYLDTIPEDDDMTPEQQAMYDIGVRASEHLQPCIDVTGGWGRRLQSPGIPKRAEEKQAGRELVDVSTSLTYVLTGE